MTDETKPKPALPPKFKQSPDPVAAAVAEEIAEKDTGESPLEKLAKATGISDPSALKLIFEAAVKSMSDSHSAEVDALRREMSELKASGHEGKVQNYNDDSGGYPWMYYRIPEEWPDEQRRGWITIGPGGAGHSGKRDAGSFNRYLNKGFIPITKYGPCPVPTDPRAYLNYVAFVKAGGWKEFPPSQLVAYGWHKANPFVRLGVRFPQMDALADSIQTFVCEYCGYTKDFMPDDKTIGASYISHMINTDKVTRKEAVEAVKAAGFQTTPYRAKAAAD